MQFDKSHLSEPDLEQGELPLQSILAHTVKWLNLVETAETGRVMGVNYNVHHVSLNHCKTVSALLHAGKVWIKGCTCSETMPRYTVAISMALF